MLTFPKSDSSNENSSNGSTSVKCNLMVTSAPAQLGAAGGGKANFSLSKKVTQEISDLL